MARPKIEIDVEQFKKLCALMCTEEEIAGFFNCSVDTVDRFCKRTHNESFAETFKKFSSNGKMALRRFQFKLAEKNAAMAIFLGKQYLGQKDTIYEPITSTETNGVKDLTEKLRNKQVNGVEEIIESENGEDNE